MSKSADRPALENLLFRKRVDLREFAQLWDVVNNYCVPWDARPKFPQFLVTRTQAEWLFNYVWDGMNFDTISPSDAAGFALEDDLRELHAWSLSDRDWLGSWRKQF